MSEVAQSSRQRSIVVVTGTRAEFGLLHSAMRAIAEQPALRLQTVVTGAHLLPPAMTVGEVEAEFDVAARIVMQRPHECTGSADAEALGRGITGIAEFLARSSSPPDFVLVLGDRIEAFAAATAAAVSGVRVAHMHGGDRAEGIADESLRHAISKLSHLHLPATEMSANRLIAMGEDPRRVHVVGSPAIDDLAASAPLPDAEYAQLGAPKIVVLLHPTGDDEQVECARAARLLDICARLAPTLVLDPNHDPGRSGVMRAIEASNLPRRAHLPRRQFLGLLRRARVIAGNSSAGLIEAAAIPLWCVNLGRRQSGRERAANVLDVESWDYQTIDAWLRRALNEPLEPVEHPYGDGRAGQRVAELLATIRLDDAPLRKLSTY